MDICDIGAMLGIDMEGITLGNLVSTAPAEGGESTKVITFNNFYTRF